MAESSPSPREAALIDAFRDAHGPSASAEERMLARLRQQVDVDARLGLRVETEVATTKATDRFVAPWWRPWVRPMAVAAAVAVVALWWWRSPPESVDGGAPPTVAAASSARDEVAETDSGRSGTRSASSQPSSVGAVPAVDRSSPLLHRDAQSSSLPEDAPPSSGALSYRGGDKRGVDQYDLARDGHFNDGGTEIADASDSKSDDERGGAVPVFDDAAAPERGSGVAGSVVQRPANVDPVTASTPQRDPERTAYGGPELRCRQRYEACSARAKVQVLRNKCRDDYATCVAERDRIPFDEALEVLEISCELDTLTCLVGHELSPLDCGRTTAPLCTANDHASNETLEQRCVELLVACVDDGGQLAACASDFAQCFAAGPGVKN